MANKQISDLPVASKVESGDLLVLERSGTAMKVDGSNVGGGQFLVTCGTLNPTDSTHFTGTCDHTADDIVVAFGDGKNPVIKADIGGTIAIGSLQSWDYSGDTITAAWFLCHGKLSGVFFHGYFGVDTSGNVTLELILA